MEGTFKVGERIEGKYGRGVVSAVFDTAGGDQYYQVLFGGSERLSVTAHEDDIRKEGTEVVKQTVETYGETAHGNMVFPGVIEVDTTERDTVEFFTYYGASALLNLKEIKALIVQLLRWVDDHAVEGE